MATRTRAVVAVALICAAAAAIVAAGRASGGAQVQVAKTSLGRILVDAKGRTLYLFAADKTGKSTCYGSCATYWPPATTKSTHVTATGVNASLLGTTKRKDGTLQITVNGHPLYRYAGDSKAGQTSGEGVNASGGLWWAVSPAGKAVHKKASSGGGSGGGGYGGSYGG
jgi:predicted lipoprotein with Yx(FWY)xxD motif